MRDRSPFVRPFRDRVNARRTCVCDVMHSPEPAEITRNATRRMQVHALAAGCINLECFITFRRKRCLLVMEYIFGAFVIICRWSETRTRGKLCLLCHRAISALLQIDIPIGRRLLRLFCYSDLFATVAQGK